MVRMHPLPHQASPVNAITIIGIILAVWLMAGWLIGIIWGFLTDWSK